MDPLTCDDLIDRGLANKAHCCASCHQDRFGMRAVIVPLPEGDAHAEVCCSQALTLNAHEYVKGWTR